MRLTEQQKGERNSQACATCGHSRCQHEFYKGDQHECGKFFCDCKQFVEAQHEVAMTYLPKNAPTRLKGKAYAALRMAVWEREAGCCIDCGTPVTLEGGEWDSMHLAHVRSRGANGADTMENTVCKCLRCHGIEHGGGKPVPKKVMVA